MCVCVGGGGGCRVKSMCKKEKDDGEPEIVKFILQRQ